jgi:hypothetical protein
METHNGEWVRDRATLTDASEASVRTKFARWLLINERDVRQVVRHRIKPAQYSRIGAVRKEFSMTVEFERKVAP